MMRRQQQQQNRQQDQQSKVLHELSALVLHLLRSPPAQIPFTDQSPVQSRRPPSSTSTTNPITPAGFAFLMLGISVALMLCGSVTFFIGFMLMPWVIGLVMVFYVVGIVSTVSMLGRSILYSVKAPSSPRKEIPGSFMDKVGCPAESW